RHNRSLRSAHRNCSAHHRRERVLSAVKDRAAVLILALLPLLGRSEAQAQCSACPNASFGRVPTSWQSGVQNPKLMTMADFDGDGMTDIVVAGDAGASFLRGLPGGRFAPPNSQIGVSGGASSFKVADFNQDGKPDLAVVGVYGVDVLLGNGDGTFSTPITVTPGLFFSLAVGDVNGDGLPDIVLAGNFQGFAVFLNTGNGAFSGPRYFAPSQPFGPVALGDFNGDGKLDVFQNGVYLGIGDGTFPNSPLPLPPNTSGQSFLHLEDFNRDGHLDVAIASPGALAILYGRGDGTFDPPVSLGAVGFDGGQRDPIVSADFNGDGFPDLALVTFPDAIEIFLSDGKGGFQPTPLTYHEGPTPIAVLAADFDRDGHPDIAVVNFYDSRMILFLGNPDGSLETSLGLPVQA